MSSSPLLDTWVPGRPAPFATGGERPWREQLVASVPTAPGKTTAQRFFAEFVLGGHETGAHAPDLDNLCEPVFSIVINRLGWFGGRRPLMRWFRVTKRAGTETGARIVVVSELPSEPPVGSVPPYLDDIYDGPWPQKATDPALAAWTAQRSPSTRSDWYAMQLRFGTPAINIGDIATGKIKPIIDCLYPIYGGSPKQPEDWRVRLLQVEKGCTEIPAEAVGITVWPME